MLAQLGQLLLERAGTLLGLVALSGQLLEPGRRILAGPGAQLRELRLQGVGPLDGGVAARGSAQRLQLAVELAAARRRLGEAALELGDPPGGLLLRPLELLAGGRGRLQLALERADALRGLGRDARLVGLRGVGGVPAAR